MVVQNYLSSRLIQIRIILSCFEGCFVGYDCYCVLTATLVEPRVKIAVVLEADKNSVRRRIEGYVAVALNKYPKGRRRVLVPLRGRTRNEV